MANVKISEIAQEIGCLASEIVKKATELGLTKVKSAASSVSEEDAQAIYIYVQTGVISEEFTKRNAKKLSPKTPSKKAKKQKEEKQEKKEQISPKNEAQEAKEEIKTKPIETLATASLQKRRGLMIVKKKETKTAPKNDEIFVNKLANLEHSFSFSENDAQKRKKKKEKRQIATKKEVAQKVDLLGDMADTIIEDDDIIVLPDLNIKEFSSNEYQTEYQNRQKTSVLKQSFNRVLGDNSISRKSRKKHKKVEKKENSNAVTSLNIPKEIRVYELADKLNKQPSEIISKLFMLGMMTTKNDFLGADEIEILAAEFGVEINIIDTQESFDYVSNYDEENDSQNDMSLRAPVITIMGHVDHGKTSLLDYIRNSRVATKEAGGITQHVGAYMVEKNGRKITFIDTPGHEAFSAMRARGAQITDIAIIVVAADDGVKPQTIEAINHAKNANVPIIIAINKIDKEGANVDMVKSELAQIDITPIAWGGENEFVEISAKTGQGIDDLLEVVLLQADILELKANANRLAKAVVIESSLQKGRGPVSTIIVENGTLNLGDTVVAGIAYGKVRTLSDDRGNSLKFIKPGECGVITGLSQIADAGETLISVKNEKEARDYAQKKNEYLRQKELSKSTKVTLDELADKIKEGEIKTLPIIVKADVGGSLEAIISSLEKLKNEEVKVDIIHSGVGGITQNDIALASASQNCIILGFNVRPTGAIKEFAKERLVEIKTYNVIYALIDDVKFLLSGLMSPNITEKQLGQAEVRQVIMIPKVGAIAGCMVTEGVISRGAKIRLIRDGVVVYEGAISSLKRFKDDAKEVAKGFECGVGIENYNDIKDGDYIESYEEIKERAHL